MNYTPYTGCPCGCTSKPPWFDDPDCIRHRPWPSSPPVTLPPVAAVPTLGQILAGIWPAPADAPVDDL